MKKLFIYGVMLLASVLLVLTYSCEKDNPPGGGGSGGNGSGNGLQGQLTKLGEEGNTLQVDFDNHVDGFDIGNIEVVSTDGEKSNIRAAATVDNPLLGEVASVMLDRYPEFASYDGTNIEVNIGMKFTEDGISFMGTGETSVKSGIPNQEQVLVRYDAQVGDVFSTSLHGKTQSQKVIARHSQKSGDMLELELIEHDVPNLISMKTFYNEMDGLIGGIATFEGGLEMSFGVTSENSNEPIDTGGNGGNGNNENEVVIGDQVWMLYNMDADVGENRWPNSSYCAAWDTEGNCVDIVYTEREEYGRLYNWETAMEVCPTGWRLPSMEDVNQMAEYLGGLDVAGAKIKSTKTVNLVGQGEWLFLDPDDHPGWIPPNDGATNESGFSALPAGKYNPESYYGYSEDLGVANYFWTDFSAGEYAVYFLVYQEGVMNWDDEIEIGDMKKNRMLSVRCIKN